VCCAYLCVVYYCVRFVHHCVLSVCACVCVRARSICSVVCVRLSSCYLENLTVRWTPCTSYLLLEILDLSLIKNWFKPGPQTILPKTFISDVIVRNVWGLGLDVHNWRGVTKVVWVIWILGKFLGVPLWSLALLSVRTFDCPGDITRHKMYCDGQLPPPKQSVFNRRLFFVEKVISLGTSIIVPAEVVSLVQFFGSRTLLLSSDRPMY